MGPVVLIVWCFTMIWMVWFGPPERNEFCGGSCKLLSNCAFIPQHSLSTFDHIFDWWWEYKKRWRSSNDVLHCAVHCQRPRRAEFESNTWIFVKLYLMTEYSGVGVYKEKTSKRYCACAYVRNRDIVNKYTLLKEVPIQTGVLFSQE